MKHLLIISLLTGLIFQTGQSQNYSTSMNFLLYEYEYEITYNETLYSLQDSWDIPYFSFLRKNAEGRYEKFVIHDCMKKESVNDLLQSYTDIIIPMCYLRHKIKSGETLYSISLKYNVDFQQLEYENSIFDFKIETGEIIFIPDFGFYHYVEQGETLNCISKLYGISINIIKELNPSINIESINEGDFILLPKNLLKHVVQTGDTFFSIAREYSIEFEELKKANDLIWQSVLKEGQIVNVPIKE